MNLLNQIQIFFSKWSIPYLFNFILLIHLIGFLSFKMGLVDINRVILTKEGILNLEFWRLISFLMIPSDTSFIYLFMFYVFYMIGNSLQEHYGEEKFNGFILLTYILTVLSSLISPFPTPNWYIFATIFLAFSTLFSHVQFYLFFVIPVKVKWLGWIKFSYMTLMLFSFHRWAVIASFLVYIIYFGNFIFDKVNQIKRKNNFDNRLK
ncbi:MAG: hypothetical protein VXW53_01880 [Verrucomicrobiota bacterium]|nr:hypothetical protein [Verrucomicrobiota bacterium]|tara:strand:+ start:101 stop:721 length:621 start_codon:yes stop_codon:yes gene_type:complete